MANRKRPEEDSILSIGATSAKKRRRFLTLEEKISILDRLQAGERRMDLSRELNINESTIRTLVKCESSIRKYAEKCTKNQYHSVVHFTRDKVLEKMEEKLYEWHEEQQGQGAALNQPIVCAKARELYEQLKYEEPDTMGSNNFETLQWHLRDFKASKGWYIKFRKRYNLECNTKPKNDQTPLTYPKNDPTLLTYPTTFAKLIQNHDYQPHQVFSALEFSFQWKRMPHSTFIAQANKTLDKIGYDRVSLLFCSNAQGNFHIKPMLINRYRAPHSFRTTKLNDLPVFWRSRSKQENGLPKVTQTHFHDWLTQCFTPSVRNYLQIMELPQRCLLLLNSDFQEMVLPAYDDSFLRLEFLPANASPLLQPLTQSILPIFQCKYLQRLFLHLLQCAEIKTKANLYKAWHKYSVADAIDIIHESLEDISTECWQSGWHKIWPGIGNESYCKAQLNEEIEQIINKGRKLLGEGFTDITVNDIKLYLKLDDDDTQYEIQQQAATVPKQVDVNNCNISHEQIFLQSSVNNNLNAKEELISFCSEQDLQSDDERKDDEVSSEECVENEIEMTINMDPSDELITEYKLSEDEAIVDYHQTEDLTMDEIGSTTIIRAQIQKNRMNIQRQRRDAHAKIRIIDKAFKLKRKLLGTLEQLGAKEILSNFNRDLDNAMQPYVEFRKKLLQPTIKDYFK